MPIFVVLADNYRAGSLTNEITVILFTLQLNLPGVRNCRLVIKIFQEDQLNFRRFPVFPTAADSLFKKYTILNVSLAHFSICSAGGTETNTVEL